MSNTKSYQAFKAKDHPQGQYTVSSGTLNSTIPYHTLKVKAKDLDCKAEVKDLMRQGQDKDFWR